MNEIKIFFQDSGHKGRYVACIDGIDDAAELTISRMNSSVLQS